VNCSVFETTPAEANQTIFGEGGFAAQAKGGSLFLNDVLALPLALQARPSMLLQNFKSKALPFRLISATGEQPMQAVTAGRMRPYHKNTVTIGGQISSTASASICSPIKGRKPAKISVSEMWSGATDFR
jgi:transcriptional regulator with AAA-type ATPase domain